MKKKQIEGEILPKQIWRALKCLARTKKEEKPLENDHKKTIQLKFLLYYCMYHTFEPGK